jgi:serine O-acetyltransferase
MFKTIREDLAVVFERDPAATSKLEVVLTYAGYHALLAYRIAHRLHAWGVPFIPRAISQLARLLTGIEIHPAAKIGRGFFIDHGMGVVIGETAEIGDHVTLFQGVTLGGTGKERGKRHPTLGNHVVVGAGAKILGGIRIGDNVKIGANSVVLKSVPANSTVIGVPGRIIKAEGDRLPEATMDHTNIPDPVLDRFEALERELIKLRKQIDSHNPPEKK